MGYLSHGTLKCLMRTQYFRWLSLLSLSLTLFWIGHVVKRDIHAAVHITGLKDYVRITDVRMDQFLDMHCNQCALVSSSGQMLGADVGEEIDKSQCVIRMNNAPTSGYEKDVGSRTTVRVVSHTSAPLLIKNEHYFFTQSRNTTYVFWGPERNMRQDGKGRIFNALLKMAKKYPDANIYSVTREKIQYCDNIFQNETGKNRMKTGAFLSTGFFTMILALDVCDSIHVYGMIDNNYCSRANHSVVPYHYYGGNRVNECRMYIVHENTKRGGHRFITEKAIYAKWATRHKMEFKHPSWRP
uniref:Alpha-N-acetylgalactosaminide alpha-2,6-sialyltransferase 3 n=1 Tax=Neogobius melanostomus TaxID=47308 RepID=A0A8C6UE61_9GOBI